MTDTPPSADQTIILFPHSWQRLLIYLDIGLSIVYFPFWAPLVTASAEYPAAAHIVPFIHLALAVPLYLALLAELPRALHISRLWFFFIVVATIALLVVSYDSLAHILRVFSLNLPTVDKLPQPMRSYILTILGVAAYSCIAVPIIWNSIRERFQRAARS